MCIGRINQLVEQFTTYLNSFIERSPYEGPSIYFHERVISLRRSAPLDKLLQCNWFIEYLYSVLVSWGMHRMDGGARLKPFTDFAREVRGIGQRIVSLAFIQLGEVQTTHINILCEVLQEQTVMVTTPRLVGNSKVFHHLLPDLVPPIDNANTLWFFENPRGSDADIFRFAMEKFKDIHNRITWAEVAYNGPMNTSRPKLIDNAIIGYKQMVPTQ